MLKAPERRKEDTDRYLCFGGPDGNMIELVATTIDGWPDRYLRVPSTPQDR
jgi:hypothetical protein